MTVATNRGSLERLPQLATELCERDGLDHTLAADGHRNRAAEPGEHHGPSRRFGDTTDYNVVEDCASRWLSRTIVDVHTEFNCRRQILKPCRTEANRGGGERTR